LVIDDSRHAPEPPPPPPPPPAEKKSGEHHYVEWLIDPKVHPLVNEIPRSAQGTYQDVASWVAAHERDPFERVKILHDFIATRIAYEYPYDRDNLPPSEPDVVFARRRAVCAGYARLFKAMYEVMNGRAVYISGEARFATEGMAGSSHAWNAAEIEGRWYLLDITWDAGGISNGRFQPKYRTDFLLTPPDFFIFSHYPFRDSWQLRAKPLTQDEFHRQPLLFPSFIAFDLKLIEPSRSQFTVRGALEVVLGNPGDHSVLVEFRARSQAIDRRRPCPVRDVAARTIATCVLPEAGDYVVYIFAALRGESIHDVVAKLEVAKE
jgi:transglutaminase/protease-like cytokinesis protein 3